MYKRKKGKRIKKIEVVQKNIYNFFFYVYNENMEGDD